MPHWKIGSSSYYIKKKKISVAATARPFRSSAAKVELFEQNQATALDGMLQYHL